MGKVKKKSSKVWSIVYNREGMIVHTLLTFKERSKTKLAHKLYWSEDKEETAIRFIRYLETGD